MNQEERATLKQKIEEKIIEIKESIVTLEELTQPIKPENSLGRISRMDAINNKSINEAALRTAKMKLTRLEYATTKVDDPKFGNCVNCRGAINPRRLMLMPESTMCIKCAGRR